MRRAVLVLAGVLALAMVPTAGHSATPRAGGRCTKSGVSVRANGQRLICTRSGSALLWKKASATSAAPLPTPSGTSTGGDGVLTPKELAVSATAVLEAATVPDTSTTSPVTITQVSSQTLANFIAADASNRFSFTGPRPLAETGDRVGAVTLATKDQRKVYGSLQALPPWGASFILDTTDAEGRFVVVTSTYSFGTSHPGTWRLAYRASGDDKWRYQSIAGISRVPDDSKMFDLVTLGKPGKYSIVLEFSWAITFYGLGINDPTSSIAPLKAAKTLSVMIVGDSWTSPIITDSAPFTQWDGYPMVFAWLTGWNVMAAGVPGQGYLHREAGEVYRDRLVRDVAPHDPDVVILTGSPNDHCRECVWSEMEIATEVRASIVALRAAAPRALVVLCSAFTASPSESALFRSVAKDLGVPYIDFVASKLLTPTNNGNHQLVDGHPTRAGGLYIAQELLKALAKLS